jgi:hypothetical protein
VLVPGVLADRDHAAVAAMRRCGKAAAEAARGTPAAAAPYVGASVATRVALGAGAALTLGYVVCLINDGYS